MAQRLEITHPGPHEASIVMQFDRSNAPAELELWRKETVLGYSQDAEDDYGRIHLVCNSDTDSEAGKCPTEDTLDTGTLLSRIPLRFSETRSGMKFDLEVTGNLDRALPDRTCDADFWMRRPKSLWSSHYDVCGNQHPSGTGVHLFISGDQLSRLVAGRWEALLILHLRVGSTGASYAQVFRFDLTITDRDRTMIYLPEFGMAEPLVGLQLDYRPIPSPGTIGGTAVLDMCLYDGMGSQSEYLAITARDMGPSAPGRPPSQYSVWHRDGGREAQDRLDYQLTLDHSGQKIALRNNEEVLLRGIDTAELRLVMLPDMNQWVYCVPTPLTLETPRVPASEKREGYYDGRLKLEMRLPTDRL
ncbi:TPA: pilin protein [Stenotrophomonas maltophilia]|nr:pilin protein [Stenotrophomonas maltophilia]HEL4289878.1 pilin protein [Stenotrophomonas maltophilia]